MMNSIVAALWRPLSDHLWQSTVFAAVVWLMTFLLRKSRAHIRYRLWLAASVKLLLSFSLLVSMGSLLPRRSQAPSQLQTELYAGFYASGYAIGRPPMSLRPVSRHGEEMHKGTWSYPAVLLLVWLSGAAAVAFVWFLRGRRVIRMRGRAVEVPLGREAMMLRRVSSGRAVPVLLTDECVEPGIVGILRPTLIWPVELSDRLNDGQMEAILRHEMLHIYRRDNLAMAMHMLVETVFWFHPMVWQMERRLIEERERACDESVMEAGTEAEVYADGILQACRFCVESPLLNYAGISGAELNMRIRSIMNFRVIKLSFAAKMLLQVSALLAIALPVMYGMVRATPFYGQILHAKEPLPSFEVATVKPWSPSGPPPSVVGGAPGDVPKVVLVAPVVKGLAFLYQG
ncbi:MAG: hypothetical protein JWM43_2375 [Acidobacteriaceae bacterium]|nr:hypothetical protein [Acidobacteriaceae bacterium]